MSKMFRKYIASFDYFGKFLIVLSATNGGISITSFATAIGAPVGIARAYWNSWTLNARVGHWTLDAGLWMLDPGHWTLDAGLWTLDAGLWTLNARLWMLKL